MLFRSADVRLITNEEYSYHDIVGILDKVDSHVGLRTHSLIFCAAVNTPMVSINSYPKNRGFMRSISQDDWMIEFDDLDKDYVANMMIKSFKEREQRIEYLQPITDAEKKKSKESVGLVSTLLDSI